MAFTGSSFTLSFWGVVVELLPCDATLVMEVERAPDTGGDAPDTGNSEIVGTADAGSFIWVDVLSNDGAKRFYRYRHIGPNVLDGEWSPWSDGAAPVIFFLEDLTAANRPSVVAARTITPTVQAIATVVAGVGTLLLEINDPDATVSKVEFAKWEGTSWSSFVEDVVAPYTTDITLQEKHNVIIAWRVTYDRGDGPVLLEDSVSYDLDILPELSNFNVTIDHSTGDVAITYTGDDDTLSIKYHDQATAYASNAAARTAAIAGTANDGRSDQDVVVESGIAEGATHYVAIVAYTGASGTGTVSTEAYLGTVTRHIDTTVPDTTAFVPTVKVDASVSGTTGTLLLTINDPESFVDRVRFKKWEGTSWSSYVEDTAAPYTTTITVQEKHNVLIGWEVRYDSGDGDVFLEDTVSFDRDLIPELSGYSVDIEHDTGDVRYSYTGDDDVLSIKRHDQSTPYASNAAARTAALSGTIVDGQTGVDLLAQSGIAEGASRYVAIVAFDAASGGGNAGPVAYVGSVTRHINTDTDTIIPTVKVDVSVSGTTGTVLLTINDPSGFVDRVRFKKWTGSSWGSYVEDVSAPFTTTITLQEKHNVAIGWEVRYDPGGGNVFLENVVSFDADEIPEIEAYNVAIEHDTGNVDFSYTGDDDVLSIKRHDQSSPYASNAAAKTAAQSGVVVEGRTGVDIPAQTGIAEGASRYVAIVAYSAAGGGGTVSTNAYVGAVTRHIDTNTQIPDTHVPTVKADASVSGTTGTLLLTINDPDGFLNRVRFKKWEGSSWGSYVEDVSAPYTTTITLQEKHDVAIGYEIRYDAGAGNVFIENVVNFDQDNIPEIQDYNVTIEHDTGDVSISFTGDDDVLSIKRHDQATAYASNAAAKTAAEGGVVVEGRTGVDVTVESGIAEGANRYVAIVAYSAAGGGGTVSENAYVGSVTRHTDTLGTPLAELTSLDVTGNIDGDVLLSYAGNETVASVRWHDQATPYTDVAAAKTAAAAGTLVAAQSAQNIEVQATIAKDTSRYVAVVAYDNAGGTTGLSEVAYQGSWHRTFINPEGEMQDDIWINSNKNIRYGSVSGGAVPLEKSIYLPHSDFTIQAHLEGSTEDYTHGIGTVAYSWVAVNTGTVVLTASIVLPEGSKLTSIIAYGERVNASQTMTLLVARTGNVGVGTTLLAATSFPVATGSWGSRTFTFTEVISDPLSVRLLMSNSSQVTGCKFGKLELVYESDNLSEAI